ncbi:MAG: hypothetical protein OJF55_002401 [Rhodanobacteraceae bacterium]|nr:MAG: hypothetical protein OJF55_002401 [Rhodanobacteraceae bacterium]
MAANPGSAFLNLESVWNVDARRDTDSGLSRQEAGATPGMTTWWTGVRA